MHRSNVCRQSGLSNVATLFVVLGIVVLALVSIYAVMRWKESPAQIAKVPLTIEVAASPEDSEIFVDGKSMGIPKTPLAFPPVNMNCLSRAADIVRGSKLSKLRDR